MQNGAYALNEFIKSYEDLFNKYNKVHNISRFKDIKNQAYDSISILEFVDFKDGSLIADIGSGAGFPAVFLAFVKKDCEFYLFEPNYKKAAFLNLIKINLSLPNIHICAKKVEDESLIKADYITSRAFARADIIIKLCENICKKDCEFIFYKGSFLQNELDKIKNYKIYEKEQRKFLHIYK
ncbi:16S rRNA (guanine(527)-N(7))-methyltransferase RsmG [Campylobacter canadensis]|uniref:Ribosomal RNA small subunit methyltransferase G n=1 Tax=Campylobacter canadensis TaxID=449520 RepID=A0ABS7WTN9_9BACT|nr:16S rRNA (guanine(527)-N(7))-methyltransferase RsmG [Campylobacter canadensis]MBZ7988133.1 16S rRNA (guanine(527)-N(7))-methyltransferase RsmG [Campylobacter canadensis]MBZ7995555.1 16S rRNA (guanine(527)-N(7))-methyltransferase RsmG [Campylobacter canadensis]MBZ7997367.1 16S rRNA (guanine(527)-N(7))-methyltransferase RsmG [Campylobacter canadensis]MBZ7999118.1 16S rRNA (guanine(527)-N(7))-methyltransferase RsmG [Campylobacter canadensis]MBZ8000927.1 16S rRNA (guanine(527)-N(7))-methyltrans